jgi:hypothetical protein
MVEGDSHLPKINSTLKRKAWESMWNGWECGAMSILSAGLADNREDAVGIDLKFLLKQNL